MLVAMLIPRIAAAAENMPGMAHRLREADMDSGIIKGQVIQKDKSPLRNGSVLLYIKSLGPPPSVDEYLRIPNIIESTDKEGRFSIKVPEGTYFVSALKWAPKSKDVGPPRDGDPIFDLLDDKGQNKEVTVKNGSVVNVGVLPQSGIFSGKSQKFSSGITAVEGIITDSEEKPVEGAIVLAAFQNHLVFASYMTGKDGKFQLRTNDGGEYSLTVTSRYGGGQPSPGDLLIVPEEGADQTRILLKKGERTKGINLKIKKIIVPTPTGSGAMLDGKMKAPPLPIYQNR